MNINEKQAKKIYNLLLVPILSLYSTTVFTIMMLILWAKEMEKGEIILALVLTSIFCFAPATLLYLFRQKYWLKKFPVLKKR